MCFLTAAKPRKTKRRKCHKRIQDNGKIVPDTRLSFRDATVVKENTARKTADEAMNGLSFTSSHNTS